MPLRRKRAVARRPRMFKNKSYGNLGKYMKRKTYKKKSVTKKSFRQRGPRSKYTSSFASRTKRVFNDMISANNTGVWSYVDRVRNPTQATNSNATQAYWAVNELVSSAQPGGTENMAINDPAYLEQIATKVNANNTTKFTIKNWQTELRMTNLSTSDVEVCEYRLYSRYDSAAAPYGDLGNSTAGGLSQGGFADATNTGIGTSPVAVQNIGVTPFMNNRGCVRFKVLKSKKFILKPGQSRKFSYRSRKEKQWNAERFAPGGTPLGCIKGMTFSLFSANGTIATNGSASAGFTVGLSSVDLGLAYKVRIDYTWTQDSAMTSGYVNNTPGFTVGSAAIPGPVVLNYPVPQPQQATGGYAAAPYVVEAFQEK